MGSRRWELPSRRKKRPDGTQEDRDRSWDSGDRCWDSRTGVGTEPDLGIALGMGKKRSERENIFVCYNVY